MNDDIASHDSRQQTLESLATAAGLAWAASWTDQVRTEGRAVRGGWPGTLSEARTRLIMMVAAQLGRAVVLTHDETLCLGKATYGAARRAWLSSAARDSEPAKARRTRPTRTPPNDCATSRCPQLIGSGDER